jgi:hypothetical protein
MESRPTFNGRVVPLAIIALGLAQAGIALHAGRRVIAVGWALVVIIGAASMRRGIVPPDSAPWRAFWIFFALVVVVAAVFGILGASL